MTHLFAYRLRNYADIHAIIQEMSAVYDPQTLLHIYHEAVGGAHSCHINLMQRDKGKMFIKSFTQHSKPN